MANHCYNSVTFVGDPENLKKLEGRLHKIKEQQTKEQYLDKGIEVSVHDVDNCIWLNGSNYHYVLFKKPDNWQDRGADVYDKYGSKWFEPYWELDADTLQLWGDSAWSPMVPFFQKICKHYKLTASGFYSESGMNFAGEVEIDSNGVLSLTEMTYHQHLAKNNPDCYWQDVLMWISEGYYEKLDAIFADFASVGWTLTEDEIKIITEAFKDFQNLPTP